VKRPEPQARHVLAMIGVVFFLGVALGFVLGRL
jgi:hypothetical protein